MSRIKIVRCPLCNGQLEIDLNSGTVYRHFEKIKPKDAVEAFDRVVDSVAEKDAASEEVFRRATEKAKDKDLDELFRRATDKAKKELEEEEA